MPETRTTAKDATSRALGDDIHTLIGEAILDGRLPEGERLRDHELAKRLGVSRTPVREALQRLEVIGLVEVAPHRYTRVSSPTAHAKAETEVFVVLTMGNASLLAARRADDAALARIVALADRLVEASRADDPAAVLEVGYPLFALITRAAANPVISRVMREAKFALRRNLVGWRFPVTDRDERTSRFEQFRDALAARDGAAAELALRQANGFA
ncbi:GntR family transcriptional regulator [Microbacterium sp. BWT-B31]|uniref:GntR family transcriptional regulator n=1 Tax=Microbacterium sp. BWT-B31 TaxID=3232072 RepID=UPI0035271C8A